MIPAQAHFCWMGNTLPWPYVFALRSAALRGGLTRVVLHHTDTISDPEVWRVLNETPGLSLAKLDPHALFEGTTLPARRLSDLFAKLPDAVGRSNMLRAALLARDGGIYLDMDTVTVASLLPLLDTKHFVGVEHIVRPFHVQRSRNPWVRWRADALSSIRNLLRIVPRGYRYFRAIEGCYHRAINGAILGSVAGGALVTRYLEAMLALPAAQQQAKYGLGTHLLQQQVAAYDADDLVIHPPPTFYPLPPEISEHWFRRVHRADPNDALRPETRIVHWYASGRTKSMLTTIDPEFVRTYARQQLYSALVHPFVP